jgi:hypothetical protein
MNSLKLWLTLRVHGPPSLRRINRSSAQAGGKFCRVGSGILILRSLCRIRFRSSRSGLKRMSYLNQNSPKHIIALWTRSPATGQCRISETVVNGHSVLRMMVISYLTGERHLEALQSAFAKGAQGARADAKALR